MWLLKCVHDWHSVGVTGKDTWASFLRSTTIHCWITKHISLAPWEQRLSFISIKLAKAPFPLMVLFGILSLHWTLPVCLLHFQVLWPLVTREGQRPTWEPDTPSVHGRFLLSAIICISLLSISFIISGRVLQHLVNPKRLFTHRFQHGPSQPSHKTNQREGCVPGAFLTPTSHTLSPSNGYRHVKHVIMVRKQHKRTYVTARLPMERAILVPSSFLLGMLILHRHTLLMVQERSPSLHPRELLLAKKWLHLEGLPCIALQEN